MLAKCIVRIIIFFQIYQFSLHAITESVFTSYNYTTKTMIYVSDSRYTAIIIMHHIHDIYHVYPSAVLFEC